MRSSTRSWWVLFVGGLFVFYLGGLYNAVGGSHVAHVLANAYFLIAGYLLFWVGLGVDPTGRPPLSRRTGIALLAAALGAYLAFALILRSGWLEDQAADQRLGAAVALAAGLIALLVAMAVRTQCGDAMTDKALNSGKRLDCWIRSPRANAPSKPTTPPSRNSVN